MLSSAPMLMGVAVLVAFGLVLSACSLPTPDPGCCNEEHGDRYVSSSFPLLKRVFLAHQMAQAVVIVRARLVSVTTGIEVRDSVNDIREALDTPDEVTYFGTLEHTFAVVEYLKGTGGDEIVGVVVASDVETGHVSREDAEQDALRLLDGRDKRWNGREAILFLGSTHSFFVDFPQDDRYLLGWVEYSPWKMDGYTISSHFDKRWLPAASAALGASTASSSGRFLLDYPDRFGPYEWFGQHRPAPSITLSKLRTMIKIVERCSLPRGYMEFRDCIGPGYPWYSWYSLDW